MNSNKEADEINLLIIQISDNAAVRRVASADKRLTTYILLRESATR